MIVIKLFVVKFFALTFTTIPGHFFIIELNFGMFVKQHRKSLSFKIFGLSYLPFNNKTTIRVNFGTEDTNLNTSPVLMFKILKSLSDLGCKVYHNHAYITTCKIHSIDI